MKPYWATRSLAVPLIVLFTCIPAAAVIWDVSSLNELDSAMRDLQDNDTVVIQPGTYKLKHGYYITESGVTIRGATGNRDDVILNGGGMNNSSDVSLYEGIALVGTDNTIKDLTIEEFYRHAIHFQPGSDRALVQNVTTRNIGEQHMKSTDSNQGIIENSLLEQTYVRTNDGVARPDNYLGGIDLIRADDWIIRDNVVRNIQGIRGGGPGILLWQDVSNAIIERNVVIGSGAGLHLGNTSRANGVEDSIVRNNFLVATSDSNDALMQLAFTKNVKVYNNTIFGGVPGGTYWFTMLQVYDDGLVLTENLDLQNNLIRGRVWDRAVGDWSSSTVADMGNLVDTTGAVIWPDWFQDAFAGDLHLTDQATGAIGQGIVLADALYDFDGDYRGALGTPTDLGADLHVLPAPSFAWYGLGDGNWDSAIGWTGGAPGNVPDDTARTLVQTNTVTVAAGAAALSLTIQQSGRVTVSDDSTLAVVENIEVLDGTLDLASTATLSIGGEFDLADDSTYASQLGGLTRVTQNVELSGTVAVEANSSLETVGSHTLTLISTSADIAGTFTNEPNAGDHLGYGTFYEDMSYSVDAVAVEVFQAAAGDTDGDRLVNNVDLMLILAANKFGTSEPADWAEGDFTGDGLANNADLQAILALNIFGQGPYAASVTLNVVPEPSTIALTIVASLGLMAFVWRKSCSATPRSTCVRPGTRGRSNSMTTRVERIRLGR